MEFHRPDEGIIEGSYHVYLRHRVYDCGRFWALCFPCTHAIAAWALTHLDCMSYVDEVYKLKQIYKVWKSEFSPVPNESILMPISSTPFELLLDIMLSCKQKGWPKSSRMRNNMNIREKLDQPKLYNYCRNPEHSKITCPHLGETLRRGPN